MTAERFERPWVLICEGMGDERFFQLMLEKHGLDSRFQVVKPSYKATHAGGRGSFGEYIKKHRLNESWIQNVRAVLIISDNDADPAKSFKEVQDDLRGILASYPIGIPDEPRKVAKGKEGPLVVVLMIPIDDKGSLETLCLDPAYQKWNLKGPLDDYVAGTPAKDFGQVKQAKMRLQAMLAATNDKDPDFGFAAHWKAHEKYRIPLEHENFVPLVEFLNGFEQLLAP